MYSKLRYRIQNIDVIRLLVGSRGTITKRLSYFGGNLI